MILIRTFVCCILACLIIAACEKDENPLPNVSGIWLRIDAAPGSGLNDTIFFSENGNARIQGIDFQYSLRTDSINFRYNGSYFILCHETAHWFNYSTSPPTLSIENLDKLCLVTTDRGISIYRKLIE